MATCCAHNYHWRPISHFLALPSPKSCQQYSDDLMAPARIQEPPVSWPTDSNNLPTSKLNGSPANVAAIDDVKFSSNLQPKEYSIFGTHPESTILFLDVNILDSTGRLPYRGDVLIEGKVDIHEESISSTIR